MDDILQNRNSCSSVLWEVAKEVTLDGTLQNIRVGNCSADRVLESGLPIAEVLKKIGEKAFPPRAEMDVLKRFAYTMKLVSVEFRNFPIEHRTLRY